jgi:predicted  nucleic acid-binding Zn-ribbon protein
MEDVIPPPSPSWRPELERLAEISRRLGTLNETLSGELRDSRKSSEELARSLESSRNELRALRDELEASRTISSGLARSAELSERESRELRTALTRAESSLRSLEASFGDYRKEAEKRIAYLERSGGRSRGIAAIASALAAAGWIAFAAVLLL